MKYRSFALSGVAALALAGALLAAPAIAAGAGAAAPATTMPSATSAQPAAPSSPSMTPSSTLPENTGSAGVTGSTGAAAAGQPIALIDNPKTALKSASVQSSDGKSIGKVQAVHVGNDGKADKLNVKLSADAATGAAAKTVAIDASKLAFDSSQKIVVAQLTPDEIKALPAISKKAAPKASPSSDMSSPSNAPSSGSSTPDSTGNSAPSTTPAPSQTY